MLTVLLFCFLYVLIDITSTLDEIIDREVPFQVLVEYYISFFPIILTQMSSIACLLAIVFTFSSLNTHNEIIVMRSSGLNFWKITKPAIIFGILISVCVFWINEKYVPKANINLQQIRNNHMILKSDRERKKRDIRNLTFYGLQNRLFFIDSFSPKTFDLKGVTIIQHDKNQNIKEKIVALKGKWTGIAWKFYQCQITTYSTEGVNRPDKIKVYRNKLMDIEETPKDFQRQKLNVTSMNIKQLNEYINKFKNSGAAKAVNNLKVDVHQKIAYPFGNFVIILIGLPFALMVKSRKRSTFTSLGIAITIGFLYYVANAVCLAFGKGGIFSPIISAWLSPFIFTAAAVALIQENF